MSGAAAVAPAPGAAGREPPAVTFAVAEGDHLGAPVVLLEPGDDDGGVEPPRVGQHDLLGGHGDLPGISR
mgnify:CR=1 FL=1